MSLRISAFLLSIFLLPFATAADSITVNFENPPYTTGVIHNKDGWTSSGAAGSGCAVYDHKVDSSNGTSGFGAQSLRISNAVTSGCFGDQTFSKSLGNAVGETGAGAGSFPIGALQSHFEMEFDITSAHNGHQPNLFMSVSPDRGDGSRMSYIGFADEPGGISINFYDVQGTSNPANFVSTSLGTYPRNQVHRIKLTFDAVNGASNDVVKVYINGVLKHTGTSWENYYRFDSEASAEQNVRAVRNVLFRTGGTAAVNTNNKGYLVDNLTISSGPGAPASATTVVVHPADMATSFPDVAANPTKWFFYNDENDTIDNTLGTFVTGPSTPPLGTGSVQISVNGTQRRNLATYRFSGTPLANITTLKFSTYNPSAGNGGSANRSAYLNFNVDFNGSDTWQRRLVFVPANNGSVTQNNWKEWDAIQGGNAKWSYSGPTWPNTAVGPHAGQTGVSGTSLRTWNEILADYPGIRIRVTDSWLGLRVGEPYTDGYTENLDKFVFGTASQVTTFDFEPAPALSSVLVHIYKFVDGVMATASNANSALFNIVAVFSSVSPPFTGTTFTLGPSSSPAPYTAVTTPIPSGGIFAGFEFTGDATTGADCAAGKPFALVGYTTGSTLSAAQSGTPSMGMPLLIGLSGDKHMIVWNKKCSTTTGSLKITKNTSGGDDTFSFTGSAGSFSITTSGGSGTHTVANLAPGTYTVNETVPSGWTMNSNTCQNVQVTAGQTATCTVTNTKNNANTGSLKVTKNTTGGDGTFNFTGSAGSFSITTSGGTGSHTVTNLSPGNYTVNETVPAGWTQNSNSCSNVTVSANSTANCTVANTKNSSSQSGTQTFTSSGTFTVPSGVSSMTVEVWGGGGGGGSSAGGASGGAGGQSSFNGTLIAGGGGGGTSAWPNNWGAGGAGGSASGGDLNMIGAPGAGGAAGGKGGDAPNGGTGANGGDNAAASSAGGFPGGGGGAGDNGSVSLRGGGGGSGGYVKKTYSGSDFTAGQSIQVVVGGGGLYGNDCSGPSPACNYYRSGTGGGAGKVVVTWTVSN